ncbi:MAG: SDR family oxidoreductase [Gammaproteobacteria bacterium]|nr:SDR family oxidoreductase [Gammaproteobacteria bacterium]
MSQKTVLITCVDRYMGVAIQLKFEELGFRIITGNYPMQSQNECEKLIESAGEIDILVANLAETPRASPVQSIDNKDWSYLFDCLVHPLMYLVRAVTPQMLDRQSGKIIAITSAAPLKGVPNHASYCAARSAQNGFIKAVGMELARSNIQINAIAQNYINNDTYYPDQLLNEAKFVDHLNRNVPTQKVAAAAETAELAAYLASDNCTHMVGQILPLAGGWIT